jgi:hypothetical protein
MFKWFKKYKQKNIQQINVSPPIFIDNVSKLQFKSFGPEKACAYYNNELIMTLVCLEKQWYFCDELPYEDLREFTQDVLTISLFKLMETLNITRLFNTPGSIKIISKEELYNR